MSSEWKEVTVRLRYREGALTPGGESRDEPETIEELVEEIDRAMNASHFGGQIDLAIVEEEKPQLSVVPDPEEPNDLLDPEDPAPRAHTSEEMLDMFLRQCGAYVHSWSQVPAEIHREGYKLPRVPPGLDHLVQQYMKYAAEGVFHSIMVTLDGGSMDVPAIDLVPAPHPEDKQFFIDEGENYWEPVVINGNAQMHEMLNKYRW